MKVFIIVSMFTASFCLPAMAAEKLSGEEILKKIDSNMTSENRVAVSVMKIHGRRITRTLKAKSWVKGVEKSFTEYLAPAREAGTKMLKDGDELWIYSPSADRIIKIAGHMLRQSMMGSDISYEDFMEDPVLSNIYEAERLKDAVFNERECYVIELTAKKEDVAYFKRKLWVDKERFLPLKEERYAKSGILLKQFTIEEVLRADDRWYPKKMIFKDMLSSGKGTEIKIESIEFDADIPAYIFNKASLRK